MLAGDDALSPPECLSTPSALPEQLTQFLGPELSMGLVPNSDLVLRHSPALLIYKPCSVWSCHMEHGSLWWR